VRTAVVFNPAAAGRDPSERRADIRSALTTAGYSPEWFETTASDAGDGMARKLIDDGVELLFVAGGDGTVMACATALAGSGIPLALLPGGTGNLLALNLGIPLDLDQAIAVALRGSRRTIDVCDMGTHKFVVMAGLGFDAAMFRDTSPTLKKFVGPIAYVVSGLKHVRSEATEVTVRIDDGPPIAQEAHLVLVGNLGRIQGGLVVLPAARPDDGLLHVAVVKAGSLFSWIRVAIRLLRKVEGNDSRVRIWSGKRVEVATRRPLPMQLDGDVVGETNRLVVEIRPATLTLCVPKGQSSDGRGKV
jgi:YegS/Rv2252/BmrU family lipid kinase